MFLKQGFWNEGREPAPLGAGKSSDCSRRKASPSLWVLDGKPQVLDWGQPSSESRRAGAHLPGRRQGSCTGLMPSGCSMAGVELDRFIRGWAGRALSCVSGRQCLFFPHPLRTVNQYRWSRTKWAAPGADQEWVRDMVLWGHGLHHAGLCLPGWEWGSEGERRDWQEGVCLSEPALLFLSSLEVQVLDLRQSATSHLPTPHPPFFFYWGCAVVQLPLFLTPPLEITWNRPIIYAYNEDNEKNLQTVASLIQILLRTVVWALFPIGLW